MRTDRSQERSYAASDGLAQHILTGEWAPVLLPEATSTEERRHDTGTGSWARDRACRALNVTIAAAALVATAPLMLVLAVLVRVTSSGPVLYTQERVGIDRRNGGGAAFEGRRRRDYGGRIFTIYKFRTMYCSGDDADQTWASPDDPRVTPVGRVMRKYRFDELPQLWNVVVGDMNIVGPRPEQPEILVRLRDEVEHYQRRQKVLPGITGWAQINHHYDRSIEDVRRKVELDLEYIERRSVAEDARILALTVPVVLTGKGAV